VSDQYIRKLGRIRKLRPRWKKIALTIGRAYTSARSTAKLFSGNILILRRGRYDAHVADPATRPTWNQAMEQKGKRAVKTGSFRSKATGASMTCDGVLIEEAMRCQTWFSCT